MNSGNMDAEISGSLPKEINHPLHPLWNRRVRGELYDAPSDHSSRLTLGFFGGGTGTGAGAEDSSCTMCGKDFSEGEPIYSCSTEDCHFNVDLGCTSIASVIEAGPLHEHPLCFIYRADPEGFSCHWCGKWSLDLQQFWCTDESCYFRLHLPCGPLPYTVMYGHGYELTLTDSLIDNTGPDDVWCDVCEEARNPSEPVYHSPVIRFTATINCLLPQIVPALKGDLGEVGLRTVGGHIPCKVVRRVRVEDCVQPRKTGTALYGDEVVQEGESSSKIHREHEQLGSSLLEEYEQLKQSENRTGDGEVVEDLHSTYQQLKLTLTDQDLERIKDAFGEYDESPNFHQRWDFHYSDDAFKQFKEQFATTDIFVESYLDNWIKDSTKFVKAGTVMIPSQFVSIYRELVDKYGDFSAGSKLSPAGKGLMFHLFFAVVYSIRETRVRELRDDLLCTWRYSLRGLQNVGFDVQFASDKLEKVVRAYFGLKVMKFKDETTEELEHYKQWREGLVNETEAKLGQLKSVREKYRKPKELDESLFKQYCLTEAAKWKWKDVGDLIF